MEKIKIAADIETIIDNKSETKTKRKVYFLFEKLSLMKDIFELFIYGEGFKGYKEIKPLEDNDIEKMDLYISTRKEIVTELNSKGIASCYIDIDKQVDEKPIDGKDIVFGFDCDCVLFDDEAEVIYKKYGLDEFNSYEYKNKDNPMGPGPYYRFLKKMNWAKKKNSNLKLVACSARHYPANERALCTFETWNIDFDAIFFCGSSNKGDVLLSVDTDIFFDDNVKNVEDVVRHGVLAGQVVNRRIH